jgi:hypothetical protein
MVATKSWEKSKVTEGVLSPFVTQGNMTIQNYRIPKATKTVPTPQVGEYVTFVSHLEQGSGLLLLYTSGTFAPSIESSLWI